MKIKLLDTFSWVGGFHLALEQSIWKKNVECIGYSEIDKFSIQVYNERIPNTKANHRPPTEDLRMDMYQYNSV